MSNNKDIEVLNFKDIFDSPEIKKLEEEAEKASQEYTNFIVNISMPAQSFVKEFYIFMLNFSSQLKSLNEGIESKSDDFTDLDSFLDSQITKHYSKIVKPEDVEDYYKGSLNRVLTKLKDFQNDEKSLIGLEFMLEKALEQKKLRELQTRMVHQDDYESLEDLFDSEAIQNIDNAFNR